MHVMVSRKRKINPQLEQLRARVAKREKDVKRKITRHENMGVKLIGSVHDPRGDMARVARYNQRQLEAHINRLDEFMNRRTQFVPGKRGVPISKQVMTNYERAEYKRNKVAKEFYDNVKGTRLPARELDDGTFEPGPTIEERQSGLASRKSWYGVTDIPHRAVNRISRGFTDEAAVKIITLDMLNQSRPGWLEKQAERERDNWLKMNAGQHQPEIVEAIRELTPFQFHVMWNYTGFATAASSEYESARKHFSPDEKAYDSVEEIVNARREMKKFIGWAKETDFGS